MVSNALGNTALSLGIRQSPDSLLRALIQPLVLAGIALLIFWTLARTALLSWADLSYVLPMTSLGYILNAFIGWGLLNEHLSAQRWMGTLLIVAGSILVGGTRR